MLGRVTILIALLALHTDLMASPDRLRVAVSVPPLAEMVQFIGGDRVEVMAMLEQSDRCGTFEVRPSRISWLASADILFLSGLTWEDQQFPRLRGQLPKLDVVDLREGLTLHRISVDHGDHQHQFWDPHIWLDPILAIELSRRIANSLAALNPEFAAEFQQRKVALELELSSLHRRIGEILEPFHGTVLLVYHPAFGYFAERYGLSQVAIQHSGREPTPRQLREILQFARQQQATTIFVQPQENRHHAEIVAQTIGADVIELDPMSTDWIANLNRIAAAISSQRIN